MSARRIQQVLPFLLALVLFAATLEVLRIELRTTSWHEITTDIEATPVWRMAAAAILTLASYTVLIGYDLLAFRFIANALWPWRIALAAALAYAISHSVGFAGLSGASVRYRFYARWGVTAEELSKVMLFYSVTLWLGILSLGGLSAVLSPLPAALPISETTVRVGGWLLLAAVAAYLAATVFRRAPLSTPLISVTLPSPAMALLQLGLSIADWVLAGSVLYVLLPSGAPPLLTFLGLYLTAILAGVVSHVPGGLGVFEGLLVLLLKPWLGAGDLLPAFVVYRAVYYLGPLVAALVYLVADEVHERRAQVARAAGWIGAATEALAPRVMATITFLSGALLLVSGATPAAGGRLDVLHRIFPLGVIELSHFAGSLAGAGLLVLSQGLARRLDAAYYLSTALIGIGMSASLLKGFDVEEAMLLLVVIVVLRRARPAFDRRAAFFEMRASAGWVAAVVGAIAASIWLGLFAFKHVEYSNDLWWRFELSGEASRFLRGSVGAAVVVLLAGLGRLLGHAPHDVVPPMPHDLDDAARVIAGQPSTAANLVFLRDKGVIFTGGRDGFVMYGVQGRSWVALGDPVGPPALHAELIRAFLDRADDFGGWPAFYEIGASGLHRYVDAGMTFVKLGEEALVDLSTVSLQGAGGARFRQALRHLEREGGTFRVLGSSDIASYLPDLRRVSDQWLGEKRAAEKGFSLGYFDESYLRRFPAAIVERGDEIVAFANLWPSEDRGELSMDLMRFSQQAPKGVMESMLVHVMLWGREQGYQRVSLGMAPLSGFEESPLASLWLRTGAFVYEHGEAVYGFQGLRAFKEKFHPAWQPRYLAYGGGLVLPRILADVAALIAGGYRRIFMK